MAVALTAPAELCRSTIVVEYPLVRMNAVRSALTMLLLVGVVAFPP